MYKVIKYEIILLFFFVIFYIYNKYLFRQFFWNQDIRKQKNYKRNNYSFSGIGQLDNKDISENDLNILLKKLYETNFFEEVSVNLKNNILTINIIENPLIQNVRFQGVKNKDILEFLNEQIKLKKEHLI